MSKLRVLEALGYVAAVMIAVGGIIDVRALRYFNVLGLVFALIVILRLMVMNIEQNRMEESVRPPDALGAEDEGADGQVF